MPESGVAVLQHNMRGGECQPCTRRIRRRIESVPMLIQYRIVDDDFGPAGTGSRYLHNVTDAMGLGTTPISGRDGTLATSVLSQRFVIKIATHKGDRNHNQWTCAGPIGNNISCPDSGVRRPN